MGDCRSDISDLVFRYAEIVDAGAFDELATLFAHSTLECQVSGQPNGGVVAGREGITKWYRAAVALHDGSPLTRHVITNLIVEIEPGETTATARSYFTVLQQTPDFALQVIAAGRYHYRFERIRGRWRFAGNLIQANFTGDLSRHYPPMAGSGSSPGSPFRAVAS